MEGIFVALAIPFKNGKLDEESLARHVDSLTKAGVDGFYPFGTTSQGPYLTLEERREALEVISRNTNRQLMVHVFSFNWQDVVETVRLAEKYGAVAISSIPPTYYRPDYETLRRYYEKLSQLTKLPIFIYNIPQNTGFNVTPDLIARLLSDGVKIAGVKDSTGDITQIMGHVRLGITVLNGADSTILPALMVGAKGCISAMANVLPEVMREMFNDFRAGRLQSAMEKQDLIAKVRELIRDYPGVDGYYRLVHLLRYDFGTVKEPYLRPLSEAEVQKLRDGLIRLGLKPRV
ncbi:dihydrodipicolinate synthase family protein [Vulcanisaeta distributa]|uniref:Dihydrodipicolinate synthetase n=1 Tax=Vulcanisaeta distributa (strain DSM 14429 / JCM 11212 / NBRC 100878 / IC-017) TaxID=572478 RepID=E1QR03_VULDI|nr:dihydrodipicolinate synthase family protein [Vulcanisaeta distributa]ADN50573.1 dihydrodipicolinate synthetase [Vulcanisaeta distributa DSM 14429]